MQRVAGVVFVLGTVATVACIACSYDWTVPADAGSSGASGASGTSGGLASGQCKDTAQCEASEFCLWSDGQCGQGALIGKCVTRPKSCTGKQGGCGCDGTKGDVCLLQQQGIDVKANATTCP